MSDNGTATAQSLRLGIAEEVRALLARKRKSASKLAHDLGWTQQYISRRLVGDQPFDADDLERIALALGVEIIDLIPRDRRRPTVTSLEPSTPLHGVPPFGNYPRGGRPSNRTDRTGPPSSPGRARRVQSRAA
jgi:transcriptional regulator with XRE-family HTH domain